MTKWWMAVAVAAAAACRDQGRTTPLIEGDRDPTAPRGDEPPVPIDPTPPFEYPAAIAAQRLGGAVLLRLFVDTAGRVVPESTSVQESSGVPALDTAAIQGAPRLRYAPALRDGLPVATVFLQLITFRTQRRGGLP